MERKKGNQKVNSPINFTIEGSSYIATIPFKF